MTRQTGYLRTSQDEALIALDKLNWRIAAIEAAGLTPDQRLQDERLRLAAQLNDSVE